MTGQEFKDKYATGERDFQNADLCGSGLGGSDLCGADLRGANLGRGYLRGANLCGADLYEANLFNAELSNADLRGADLRGADLCEALLWKCNLAGAKLDPGALSAKQIADGLFDHDILEKQGWVRKADCGGATNEIPQPRKLHALKVEFDDIDALFVRVLNEDITREQQGEALDKLALAWNLNLQGDVISAADYIEDVNEILA